MLKLQDYLSEDDIKGLLSHMLAHYKTDSRIATWMADHIFGKAPQAVELSGPDGGRIQISGMQIVLEKSSAKPANDEGRLP